MKIAGRLMKAVEKGVVGTRVEVFWLYKALDI